MLYVIMAAGNGKRWNNYKGIPKHLVEINGETLLGRTTRLLKENGIDYIITGSDKRYAKYGKLIPQSCNECEIDRYEPFNEPVCYLYGDVYYTKKAIKTIIETDTDNIHFFGSDCEIFAVKVNNIDKFFILKMLVKNLYMQGKIDRCIGWEIYKAMHGIPLKEHYITDDYTYILDGTDDIDFPEDYEKFKNRWEVNYMKDYIVKALFDFNDTAEKLPTGGDTPRKINDVWDCTKERFEFLNSKGAVMLVGIKEKEEAVEKVEEEPIKEETKKKGKRKAKITK